MAFENALDAFAGILEKERDVFVEPLPRGRWNPNNDLVELLLSVHRDLGGMHVEDGSVSAVGQRLIEHPEKPLDPKLYTVYSFTPKIRSW